MQLLAVNKTISILKNGPGLCRLIITLYVLQLYVQYVNWYVKTIHIIVSLSTCKYKTVLITHKYK